MGVSIFDVKENENEFAMYCSASDFTKEEAKKTFENSKYRIVEKVRARTQENFWEVENIHLKHLTKKCFTSMKTGKKRYAWEGIFEVYTQCCGNLD